MQIQIDGLERGREVHRKRVGFHERWRDQCQSYVLIRQELEVNVGKPIVTSGTCFLRE